MILKLGLSVNGAKRGAAFPSADLTLNTAERSEFELIDQLGSNNVDIFTPTHKGTATSSLIGTVGEIERMFDGGSYTIYFKINQLESDVFTRIFEIGRYTSGRGIWFKCDTNIRVNFSDGTTNYNNINVLIDPNNNLLPIEWAEVFIRIDYPNRKLKIDMYDESDGSQIGSSLNYDISAFNFNDDNNAKAYTILAEDYALSNLKKFSELKTIEQCRDDDYVTDLQLWYPELLSGVDVGGNQHHLTRNGVKSENNYYSQTSSYMLNNGYSLFRSLNKWNTLETQSTQDVYVPYGIDGNPITLTILDEIGDEYVHISDHEGNLTEHNLAESRLNIPIASWDKSDTDLFEDVVRSSIHYNTSNVDEWHISELDYLIFSQRCKANHKATNFFKITDNSLADKKILKQIFSYSVDKESILNNILRYTGDYAALNNAVRMYNDASINDAPFVYVNGTSGNPPQIYWGDGTRRQIIPMDGTDVKLYRFGDYQGTEDYPIYIFNPENIEKFAHQGFLTTSNFRTKDSDIAEFNKCTSLKYLYLNPIETPWNGSINGLSKLIETMRLYDCELTDGSLDLFTKLKTIDSDFSGTGNMAVANMPDLESIDFSGTATININITGLTKLKRLNNQYAEDINLEGDFSGKPDFEFVCWGQAGTVDVYGDVTNSNKIYNFDIRDDVNVGWDITGVVTNWTLLKLFSINNSVCVLTGDIPNAPDLHYFRNNNTEGLITKPTSLSQWPKMCMFWSERWDFTESEQNQILADLWSNRDEAREEIYAYRSVNLAIGSTASPSGQGLVDTANLRLYRSPNNDLDYELWTITIND